MSYDLVVIGAGWAGCNAALRASRRGFRVLLLEQAAQPGGRAGSFVDPVDGMLLDNGQHLFLGAYHETLDLLGELGTAPWIEFETPLRIPFLSAEGRLQTLQSGSLPGPLGLFVGLMNFQTLPAGAVASLSKLGFLAGPRLLAASLGYLGRASEKISVQDWLLACGQSPELILQVWEPMVLAALNARPQQARLREFLAVLSQGFLRGGQTAALGRAQAPLVKFLTPLGAVLAAQGSELRCNTAVEGVTKNEKAWSLKLRDGSVVESDRCILALPARLGTRLLGPELAARTGLEQEALRPHSPIVSVWLWSEAPLLPAAFLAFGPQGSSQPGFHWGFSDKLESGWRTCIVTSAAEELAGLSNEDILARLRGFLSGRGLPIAWARARVIKEKTATPRFEPGSSARLKQATKVPGLALAGDYTETGLPATIEGAVRSGRLALESLLNL